MAQTKILLDTNSYLRLAQNLHPLLFQSFGTQNYTLFVHKELKDECLRQPRLAHKFDWITLPKYEENRSRPLTMSKAQHADADQNFDFIWGHVQSEELSPSKIDVRILATAMTLGIRVVTDDQAMLEVAAEFDIATWSTLELMKEMREANHISMEEVRRVVDQWIYEKDMPARALRQRYREFFGEDPPAGF
jgi:hypothetical protein